MAELARHQATSVFVSLTSLDPDLIGRLEPRTSRPALRLQAIEALAQAGVPVGVLLAPLIPGLNDHEIPAILEAAAAAGARFAGRILLRLPGAVEPLFLDWLEREFPQRSPKVLARLRLARGGRLNDPNFHTRMRGQGPYAQQLNSLFRLACRRAGLLEGGPRLSCQAFRRPGGTQLKLFAC